jgi:cytochrome b subunit of formate dehydrogenase/NAD-dependent dihydropyrimidine dehydrogenase PreA subunit
MEKVFELNTDIIDLILDGNESPVAKMRLFSDGINPNNRLLGAEEIVNDKGCIACGNCIDGCPVVKDSLYFVFLQNKRTSMSLEYIVGDECRRCYNCIRGCPQVSKIIKEYTSAYRRGEKVVHLLTAVTILLLAFTGITIVHYIDILPKLEISVLRYSHRISGTILIFMPLLYFLLDRHHLVRMLKKTLRWGNNDRTWIKKLVYHLKDFRKNRLPYSGEFNTAQKAWYLYILFIMFPVLSTTGLILMLNSGYFSKLFIDQIFLIHMSAALVTDLLLFVHIYFKYLRKWIILTFDMFKIFIKKKHLIYSLLYD